MSVPEHMPTTPEGKLVRLMEECGETIQAASKVLRFGDRSYGGGCSNGELLEAEMSDLIEAIDLVREWFRMTTPHQRTRKACP